MSSRGLKSWMLLALFGLVVAFFAIAAMILIVNGRHDDAVAEADTAADRFAVAKAAHEKESVGGLSALYGGNDYGAMLDVIDGQLASVPGLKELDGYGPEHSEAYQAATEVSSGLGLRALKTAVADARASKKYVAAARKALANPRSLFPDRVEGPDELVKAMAPKLKSLRSGYEKAAVPDNAEKADTEVTATLDFMIAEIKTLAVKLKKKQSYFIEFEPRYKSANAAVDKVEKSARSKIDAAVKAVIT